MDAREEESELLLFPNLVTTLETLLQESNLLKYNLSLQIKEANSVTEWELPNGSDNESDEQPSAEGTECVEGDDVDSALEEIVSESISSAIEHAQNVRKKLTLNKMVNKGNKTKSEQDSSKVAVKPKMGIAKEKTMTVKMSSIKSGTKSKPSTPDGSTSKNQKLNNNKTEKKCSQQFSKRKTTHLETTYQKDYLSVAKQMQKTNLKSLTTKRDTKQSESQTGTGISKKKNIFSFTDIDNLLSRVTPYPNTNPSSQSKRSLTNNTGIATSREEVGASRKRTCEAGKRQIEKLKLKKKASLKEAIDVVGVPSELETISKVYHKFLDQKKYYSEEEDTLKNEFLNQLKVQNKNKLINGFSHQPDIQAKVAKFLSIAENMEEENINFKLDVKSSSDLLGGFSSNEDLCVYYSGREQLEMFEKKQDELMQLKLKLKVCDSVLKDLNNSVFEEKQITSVYRVVSALKDITSLSVPVIFRK